MVALCSSIITLHNNKTLFISFQVREFCAHYYSKGEIGGCWRGILWLLKSNVREVPRHFVVETRRRVVQIEFALEGKWAVKTVMYLTRSVH